MSEHELLAEVRTNTALTKQLTQEFRQHLKDEMGEVALLRDDLKVLSGRLWNLLIFVIVIMLGLVGTLVGKFLFGGA